MGNGDDVHIHVLSHLSQIDHARVSTGTATGISTTHSPPRYSRTGRTARRCTDLHIKGGERTQGCVRAPRPNWRAGTTSHWPLPALRRRLDHSCCGTMPWNQRLCPIGHEGLTSTCSGPVRVRFPTAHFLRWREQLHGRTGAAQQGGWEGLQCRAVPRAVFYRDMSVMSKMPGNLVLHREV